MLLKESNDAKEEMYTGTQHLVLATMRMQGHDVPDRTLDADLDRFRRSAGQVPSA
jgi:hypothetical protein